MASLKHRFDLLDVRADADDVRAFNVGLTRLLGRTPPRPRALADMLRASGWQLELESDGAFHIYGYADVGDSRVRDSLRWLEAIAPRLRGRLLYQDVRGLLLDYRFAPRPRLQRLGRSDYDAAVAALWVQTDRHNTLQSLVGEIIAATV